MQLRRERLLPVQRAHGSPPPLLHLNLGLSTFAHIVAASFAGGVLSIIAAAGTLALHPSWITKLVSFAVGALLGAVFLELLPHALETGSTDSVMTTVLAGLLAFFLLEKFVLWRHSHDHEPDAAQRGQLH